jgi:hypothetical protein
MEMMVPPLQDDEGLPESLRLRYKYETPAQGFFKLLFIINLVRAQLLRYSAAWPGPLCDEGSTVFAI